MTGSRDPNLVIGAWLEEGPLELPDDSRRAITTSVRTLPQRRRGLGWSFNPGAGQGILRPALLAAAVVLAVGSLYLLKPFGPSESVGPPVGSSPSAPSASPVPPASSVPSVTPLPPPTGL